MFFDVCFSSEVPKDVEMQGSTGPRFFTPTRELYPTKYHSARENISRLMVTLINSVKTGSTFTASFGSIYIHIYCVRVRELHLRRENLNKKLCPVPCTPLHFCVRCRMGCWRKGGPACPGHPRAARRRLHASAVEARRPAQEDL